MSNLNRDILYLIFKQQLQDDKKTLCSCLLVNKTWCKMIVPILWKNPWESLKREHEIILLKVIITHLSCDSRKKIEAHIFNLLSNFHRNPSFNYISYCKHLNLDEILRIVSENIINEKTIILNVQTEVLNLFLNKNMKFTHLYMRRNFKHRFHLIHGAERCFSEIEFLSCSTCIDNIILTKLIESCESIKELKLFIELENNNNYRIIKLIEAQRKLSNVDLVRYIYDSGPFCKILEDSLIKHAIAIQYCRIIIPPSTNFLSSFVNLKELELGYNIKAPTSWNCIGNLSFPFLQILKSSNVPIDVLTSLIKNTNRNLIEIKIGCVNFDEIGNKKLIQAIYLKCPNIRYLTLLIRNCNILELEMLLISCQHLNGLYILINNNDDLSFDWNKLFEVLTKSSPTSLFKIKFHSNELPTLETFKLFFDNWSGRKPMFLQNINDMDINSELISRFKSEGIVVKGLNYNQSTEDFE
ncbi:hypothetical protein RclHR1_05850003 [Rhizophagus clarus]|uniref:F-box domain-containing protein n=1 Tax=Rhizophagus clarus TaxID=94130 RepID=A0A2Z6RQ60_9GLOM|nr:hypothetical protein RclHR1_05850003 [Rhizophagus clarus]GES74694.1 hypothetical protein GLOIN_2v1783316 [Rhizophagus clarus]